MNRIELAVSYHDKGYNCCQSVLGAFHDRMDIPLETVLRLGAGFGSGAGTGELCGAIAGAVMALDLIAGGDVSGDIAGSKRRAAARSRELQKRFSERFGALRCRELLRAEKEDPSEQVAALHLTNHCAIMVAQAAQIADELLTEEET